MKLFEDDDDYMVDTPKENFFSIVHSANKNIVDMEIEKLIERLAIAEKLLEENGLEEEYEREVKTFPFSNPGEMEELKNSLFIETVGAIVSKCE